MQVYWQAYCRVEQDNWVQLFAIAEYAYNNSQ